MSGGYNPFAAPAVPAAAIRPGDVWICELRDPLHTYPAKQPVLVMGRATTRPAASLMPLIHVIPLFETTASDFTTLSTGPFRSVVGHVSPNDWQVVAGLTKKALGLDANAHGARSLGLYKGAIHPLLKEKHRFETAAGMVVVAGQTTSFTKGHAHAMPLVADADICESRVQVGNMVYGIDTRQVRPVNLSSLGPMLDRLGPTAIGRLDRIMTERLGI
jgi:hypothetical protein